MAHTPPHQFRVTLRDGTTLSFDIEAFHGECDQPLPWCGSTVRLEEWQRPLIFKAWPRCTPAAGRGTLSVRFENIFVNGCVHDSTNPKGNMRHGNNVVVICYIFLEQVEERPAKLARILTGDLVLNVHIVDTTVRGCKRQRLCEPQTTTHCAITSRLALDQPPPF